MVARTNSRPKSASARIDKATARRAARSRDRVADGASPAATAARFGVPVLATFQEFGELIRRSARTVARLEQQGLPVIRPGREPLVLVERALNWIEAGKPRPRSKGRPRNIDRGERQGGDR